MATILEFRAQYAKTQNLAERAPHSGPAEVVIFPGVRYERETEAETEPPRKSRSRRSRPRDRLELED